MDVGAFLKNFKQTREAAGSSHPSDGEVNPAQRSHSLATGEGDLRLVLRPDEDEEEEEKVSTSDEEENQSEEENELAFGMFHTSRKRMRSVAAKYAAPGAHHSAGHKDFSPLQVLQTNATQKGNSGLPGLGQVRRRTAAAAAAALMTPKISSMPSSSSSLPAAPTSRVKRSSVAIDAWRSTLLQQKQKLQAPQVQEHTVSDSSSAAVHTSSQANYIPIDDLLSGSTAEADLEALLNLEADQQSREEKNIENTVVPTRVDSHEEDAAVHQMTTTTEPVSNSAPPPSPPSSPSSGAQGNENKDASPKGNTTDAELSPQTPPSSNAVAPVGSANKQPAIKKKVSLFARAKEIAKNGESRDQSQVDTVAVKRL